MNQDIKDIINEDKDYYYGRGLRRAYRFMTHNPLYQRGKYVIAARKAGYYTIHGKSVFDKIRSLYYVRKKNIMGERLGIELGPNEFGRRIKIYHNNIVINCGTIIGDDCELYGSNCVGNKGSESKPLDAPILGNGVSIGVGAKIIGKVHVADNVKISSMSLVNKNIDEPGALYGGVPAKKIEV